MGDAEDFTNFMTAVIDERAFDKIASYIDHAKSASDAEVIAGGEYDNQKATSYALRLLKRQTHTTSRWLKKSSVLS